MPWKKFDLSVNASEVEARARAFADAPISVESKPQLARRLIQMMDLTTLEGDDTEEKIHALCQKARAPVPGNTDVPPVAAVCLYPRFATAAKKSLADSGVKVAVVTGGFPAGQAPSEIKLRETKWAIAHSADEIDYVICRGDMIAGAYESVFEEIRAVRALCLDRVKLKVILETGELESYKMVRRASLIALTAGAHFIKTSTGKKAPGATLEAAWVMMSAIRDFYRETGESAGFKPAGGIKTVEAAASYLAMGREVLGEGWMTPSLFRFGASSLLDNALKTLDL